MPSKEEKRILKLRDAGELPYTDIIVEKKDSIGYITINRPEKRNALSMLLGGTCDQLSQAYREMKVDPDIRVFLLKGAGDCFCSGFDLGQYDEGIYRPREKGPWKGRELEALAEMSAGEPMSSNPEMAYPPAPLLWSDGLWDSPTPSVALVHSFCLGAGLWTINQCDIVYAAPTAVFAYPPIRYGASAVLDILPPWILGLRRAMEMGLTGRFITAEEAYSCGLITRIVPEEKLEEEGQKVAESIAKVPVMTNYCTKMAMHNYFDLLNMRQAQNFGQLLVYMTEQSSLPGHYLDFFELVRKKGVKQGYQEQREKWGYPDEVLDREVARLREKKGTA